MIALENKILPIISEHKTGEPIGITSICSANAYVIKAAIINAKINDQVLVIESTSNQVDQYGGYTGITPSEFRKYVYNIASRYKFPYENLILGGDHLGPNSWQNENLSSALLKAKELISAYLSAGYTKIHLDASMKCLDDGDPSIPLNSEIIAERTAILCRQAENTFKNFTMGTDLPVYIIGSDVPPPGGAKNQDSDFKITLPEEVETIIYLTKKAFKRYDIENVWERVVGVVVQPGVEFGDSTVHNYDKGKARQLSNYISSQENIIYEAHSTDYQTKFALRQMVKDHFAILKVGPWLTFAFREAVFGLSYIERELLSQKRGIQLSNIIDVVDKQMIQNPKYYNKYYSTDNIEQSLQRKFSYSDRIRYYWTDKNVSESVQRLISNLSQNNIPDTLISQFFPSEYDAIIQRKISNHPEELINHKILSVLENYNYAVTGGAN